MMYETFDDIQRDIARRLTGAAEDRHAPMHVPAVVTSDVDARSMVLRSFDPDCWTLRFHTDLRAPKVAAIRADPRMAVLFYDKAAKIQIRVRGHGAVAGDGVAIDAAWAGSTNFARRCYLGEGPGAESNTATSGLPPEFERTEPTDEELLPARTNFAILTVTLAELDWFYLAHSGHSRALFTRHGEDWQGRWVAP